MSKEKNRHRWSKDSFGVMVHGAAGRAVQCAACGVQRTKAPDAPSLFVYRQKNSERWDGYKSGYTPPCPGVTP